MRSRRKPTSLAAALAAALAVPAAATLAAAPATSAAAGLNPAAFDPGVTTDPLNAVFSAQFENGKVYDASVTELDPKAFGRETPRPKDVKEDAPRRAEKIQPALAKLIAAGEKRANVLVTYVNPFTVPAFPVPALDEDRDSDVNRRQLAAAEKLISSIQARRESLYKEQGARLEQLGGKVLDSYWLIQAHNVNLPLDAVKRLAESSDVQYLELSDDLWEPPADADPDNDTIDARAQIASDPYFSLGQTSGWIGLLDTGVRTTHNVFNAPDHIAIAQDLTGDGDPTDQCNHGTSSAALITGNSRLGGNWRGLSAISVDSWDIYGNDCLVGSAHAIRGFEEAVRWLDRVIVAEIQIAASETSALSTAADNAYDAGSVVVSANGNFGPGVSTVRSPANAHKSLGIGAADLKTDNLMNYSGRGPTADGRYKPDLVFPTNVETASNTSNTGMRVFTGTSTATPIAGGAIALMRNWQRGGTGSLEAGHVYSHAILGGQTTWPFNNNTGAGPFVLGTNGHAWWGKVNVGNGGTVNIPISVTSGKTKFEGALWWPESTGTHNDIDLRLVSPAGTVFDSSISAVSVFERASVLSGLYPGTWTLRISGFSVSGSQTVYWSARTR